MNADEANDRLTVAKQIHDNIIAETNLVSRRAEIQYLIEKWICNGDDTAVLDLSRNRLTELPDNLPNNLQELNCTHNQLTKLPDDLPDNLQYLNCYNNQLTELPDNLPINLQELVCNNNRLTKLPDNLPDNLQKLDCSYNQLSELPYILPNNLQKLYCSHNYLIKMPNIPDTLREICCDKQQTEIYKIMECNNMHSIRQWWEENPQEVIVKSANKQA